LQLRELREFALHRGWEIASEYVDQGVSGSKESRPQLNRLMADARKRRFDLIAVWKLDRFGRSLKHLVMTLADLESLRIASSVCATALIFRRHRAACSSSSRALWPNLNGH
jgi:DNA invertase Pin-like site-specific DNA recombinase